MGDDELLTDAFSQGGGNTEEKVPNQSHEPGASVQQGLRHHVGDDALVPDLRGGRKVEPVQGGGVTDHAVPEDIVERRQRLLEDVGGATPVVAHHHPDTLVGRQAPVGVGGVEGLDVRIVVSRAPQTMRRLEQNTTGSFCSHLALIPRAFMVLLAPDFREYRWRNGVLRDAKGRHIFA